MSYIHEALKKAQREKDILAGKYAKAWSTYRSGHRIFKKEWLVSGCLIVIAVAFSAYSWLHSLPELSLGDKEELAVHHGAVGVPDRLDSTKAVGLPLGKPALNSRTARPKDRPTSKTLPLQKKPKEETQEPTHALESKPRPDNAATLYSQALALQKQGRLDDAKKLYETALERSPRLVSALNNLGAIYIKEKNYAAARRVLEKAIRIDPDYVDPYYNLGCVHALQKDVGRSIFYLKKAVSIDEAVRKWAETDKDLQNLRGHSEYEKIIQGTQKS